MYSEDSADIADTAEVADTVDADDGAGLSVSEMAQLTGISAHTLRYYERAGLIQPVSRTAGNQRRYDRADVAWVQFLLRLRATGMPIRHMKTYADLRERGPSTAAARLAMLSEHQRSLRAQIAELRGHDAILSQKIRDYQAMLDAPTGSQDAAPGQE